MTKQAVNKPRTSKASLLPWFALFGVVFVYVWLRIEPVVEHHAVGPFFYIGHAFFEPFVRRPGGLVEYAATFLGQLNYLNWPGALSFCLITVLIFLSSRWLFRRITGLSVSLPSATLILFLLLLRNDYGSPALAVGIGLALACGVLQFNLVFYPKNVSVRLVGCLLAGALVFYLAGAWPAAFFALMTAFFEARFVARWAHGVANALFALLPVALYLVFDADTSVHTLFQPWDSSRTLLLVGVLHLLLPLSTAASLFLTVERVELSQDFRRHRKQTAANRGRPWSRPVLAYRLILSLIMVAGALTVWFTFNEQRRIRAKIDLLSSRGEHTRVLQLVPALPVMDLSSQIRLHLALYHSDLLTSRLFGYGYPVTPELLPGILGGLPTCRAQTQVLLELGLVNDAEHLAHEALEYEGNRPDLLRALAEINVLKGRPKAARVFLNVLNQVPFERKWASAQLQQLDSDPSLAGDVEILRTRSCLLTNDLPHSGLPTQALLGHLLRANSSNKMAFEYLLTSYLFDCNLTNALGALPHLKPLGYTSIPRHLEEAILLHQHLNGALVDLHGAQLSADTRRRFEQFRDLLTRLPNQGPQRPRTLATAFGDTYWNYYILTDSRKSAPPQSPPS